MQNDNDTNDSIAQGDSIAEALTPERRRLAEETAGLLSLKRAARRCSRYIDVGRLLLIVAADLNDAAGTPPAKAKAKEPKAAATRARAPRAPRAPRARRAESDSVSVVVEAIRAADAAGAPLTTVRAIAKVTGKSKSHVGVAVYAARREGLIERTPTGYRAAVSRDNIPAPAGPAAPAGAQL